MVVSALLVLNINDDCDGDTAYRDHNPDVVVPVKPDLE